MNQAATEDYAEIVGESNCVAGAEVCTDFSVDGLVPRSVVFPCCEDQVARVLKRAAERGLAVIACGSGTKLGVGNAPRNYDLALSLGRMDRVRHFEPADLTASVESGVKLGDFEDLLRPHGLWLPVDPPGSLRSTLGGIVAANASGPLRLHYGSPRDFVLGLRIATTEGKIIKAGGKVVKNVAGYDLTRLLTGSFGTLGVIVEISLKLFPLPAHRATWRVMAAGLDVARQFRRSILQSPLAPMRMVLLDRGAAAIARGDDFPRPGDPFEIWIETGGSERVNRRFGETLGAIADNARASADPIEPLETGVAEAAWNRIADFTAFRPPGEFVAVKASVPITSSEAFVELVGHEAEQAGARHACFSQNGVGVVRACLMGAQPDGRLVSSVARLRAEAVRRGGALVVERASEEVKRALEAWGYEGSDLGVMSKIKRLWDPNGTLAPGRFVGGL
ncbi:MAG: FAD-binding oxidoreductase [Terriglobia bacterium]